MKNILVVIFLFLTMASTGQTVDFNKGGFATTDYFIEIPFQNINGKIIVEVEIGGRKRNFIVDDVNSKKIQHFFYNYHTRC